MAAWYYSDAGTVQSYRRMRAYGVADIPRMPRRVSGAPAPPAAWENRTATGTERPAS